MTLTKEYLLETRANAVAKRQELANMIQQANGAIDMLDYLLQQIEQQEPADTAGEQGASDGLSV